MATLSILAQFVYNIEASRYALFTGEPIMTGKFRTLPGPGVWLAVYMVLDLGALLPYQIGSVATPLLALWLGELPKAGAIDTSVLRWLSYGLLAFALLPLVFGGKVYNSLKTVMTIKIIVVFGFLLVLAFGYSTAGTWREIGLGLLRFGEIPLGDGKTANVVGALAGGQPLSRPDHNAMLLMTAFAAIAGVGGLAQTSISNYTRDQGWGMGARVGAIPSFVGGHAFQLSHVGMVFRPTVEALREWRGWMHQVLRDQAFVWVPASFIGLALPAMLSVEFLARGTVADTWSLAGLTAGGVQARVGGALGDAAWVMVLLCALLVIVPNTTSAADAFIRRWVEVSWTGVRALQRWDPHRIRTLYFAVLGAYFLVGLVLLVDRPAAVAHRGLRQPGQLRAGRELLARPVREPDAAATGGASGLAVTSRPVSGRSLFPEPGGADADRHAGVAVTGLRTSASAFGPRTPDLDSDPGPWTCYLNFARNASVAFLSTPMSLPTATY